MVELIVDHLICGCWGRPGTLGIELLGGVVATVVRSCAKIGSANVNLVIVS